MISYAVLAQTFHEDYDAIELIDTFREYDEGQSAEVMTDMLAVSYTHLCPLSAFCCFHCFFSTFAWPPCRKRSRLSAASP